MKNRRFRQPGLLLAALLVAGCGEGGGRNDFFKRDGGFYVTTADATGREREFQITYVFGVDPLQQYLVEFPGGRLQALAFSWDTRPVADGRQRWFHIYEGEYIAPCARPFAGSQRSYERGAGGTPPSCRPAIPVTPTCWALRLTRWASRLRPSPYYAPLMRGSMGISRLRWGWPACSGTRVTKGAPSTLPTRWRDAIPRTRTSSPCCVHCRPFPSQRTTDRGAKVQPLHPETF